MKRQIATLVRKPHANVLKIDRRPAKPMTERELRCLMAAPNHRCTQSQNW